MCTLTFAWQVFDDAPLVVAANRDEVLDRPARPPERVWTDPDVLAPRDEEAGGTWIGVNEHGVFVGITNRWTDADLEAARSRGLLVRDALSASSAAAATDRVTERVDRAEYDGFNLLVADADTCTYLEWDGELAVESLEPGVHVVVNVGRVGDLEIPGTRREYGERQAANARLVHDDLEEVSGETAAAWRNRAASVLRDHDYGVCVHGDGYGTRSSSLVQLGESIEYWFANGPPCETEYDPVLPSLEGDI